jgi:hypothetical protein
MAGVSAYCAMFPAVRAAPVTSQARNEGRAESKLGFLSAPVNFAPDVSCFWFLRVLWIELAVYAVGQGKQPSALHLRR